MLGGVKLPGDQEGRGQKHSSFSEEGPDAAGAHGEAQEDKGLTGQWLLWGGVLATLGDENPQVFLSLPLSPSSRPMAGTGLAHQACFSHRDHTHTCTQLCTPRDTRSIHGEHTCM